MSALIRKRTNSGRQALFHLPERIVRNLLRNSGALGALVLRPRGGMPMKSILTILAAGLLAGSFAISADAASKKIRNGPAESGVRGASQEEILGHPLSQ